MIGPQIRLDPYHVAIVRTPLTRNLGSRFSDIKDEISAGFADLIPAKDYGISFRFFLFILILICTSEWTSVDVYKTIMQIVCRTSNRLYVDLPLCECWSNMSSIGISHKETFLQVETPTTWNLTSSSLSMSLREDESSTCFHYF